MSLLSDRIGVSRAALTTLVDRMEKVGIIERHAAKHDRRQTHLVLSCEAYDQVLEALFGTGGKAVAA